MKPRYTSTIIEKTEKAELVRFEFKGKVFYKVLFNIRPNDGTGLPGYSTMCDIKEGFGDDEGAARAFFEEKKNGEQTKEETKEETTEVSHDIQKAFDVLNFGLVELDKIGTETAKKWYSYLLNESGKLRTEKDIAKQNKMIEKIISQKDKVKKMIELAKSGK